jgi:hypothetical protein
MFEAEIIITGYTIVVVSCTLGVSKLVSRKRTKQTQKEINELKASLLLLEKENRKLKS